MNLPAYRDDPPPMPAPPVTAHAYPLTPAPAPSIGDATRIVQRVLDIVGRFGDELQDAVRQPYPCAVCQIDMSRWVEWQRRKHFLSHPLPDRARAIGWFRAVIGS